MPQAYISYFQKIAQSKQLFSHTEPAYSRQGKDGMTPPFGEDRRGDDKGTAQDMRMEELVDEGTEFFSRFVRKLFCPQIVQKQTRQERPVSTGQACPSGCRHITTHLERLSTLQIAKATTAERTPCSRFGTISASAALGSVTPKNGMNWAIAG